MKKIIFIIIPFILTVFLLYYYFLYNKGDVKEDIMEPKIKVVDGVTYINGILIVNKTYSLPKDYVPNSPFKEVTTLDKGCPLCIEKEAYNAFLKMQEDAKNLGLELWIQSGFRPYNYQENLYNRYVFKDGQGKADMYSSRPGHSEHQSGLAFDLNSVEDDFINTKEGKFVHENAYKYGFIIRFPKGEEEYTGYKYEPWHLRYVGKDLASKLYKDNNYISLERYFNIDSIYK